MESSCVLSEREREREREREWSLLVFPQREREREREREMTFFRPYWSTKRFRQKTVFFGCKKRDNQKNKQAKKRIDKELM